MLNVNHRDQRSTSRCVRLKQLGYLLCRPILGTPERIQSERQPDSSGVLRILIQLLVFGQAIVGPHIYGVYTGGGHDIPIDLALPL